MAATSSVQHDACARHGLRYDLKSGACLSRGCSGPLRTYRAWIESGHVFLASSAR